MTEAEIIALLNDGAIYKTILVDVGVFSTGSEKRRYLSTVGWVSHVNDVPAATYFTPCIAGGVNIRESISLDGEVSQTFGDIEIFNTDGLFDSWLDDVWQNRTIRIYVGDSRFAQLGQFHVIFDGIVSRIESRSRDRLNIILRDKMERLNHPLHDVKIGGTNVEIKDNLRPLCFGEVFNITPEITNASTHEYMVHNGAIEQIIEVRDNGMPVAITPALGTGKFTLNNNPVGTITCSVQGDAVGGYRNTPVGIIKHVVQNYGNVTSRLVATDIDDASMNALDVFDGPGWVYVGEYVTDRETVLEFISRIAWAIRSSLFFNRAGKLAITQIAFPVTGAIASYGVSDIAENSLEIAERLPVKAACKIAYNKNWTVQPEVAGGVLAYHKCMFQKEWLFVNVSDAATATKYVLSADGEAEETCIQSDVDATDEANARLAIYKEQRNIFRFRAFARALLLNLGDRITVTYPRFGLNSGKQGIVMGLEPDWLDGVCVVEVLI